MKLALVHDWLNQIGGAELVQLYPDYEFSRHKGYGIVKYLSRLKFAGVSEIHRQGFKP
jgi:ribonuclease HII